MEEFHKLTIGEKESYEGRLRLMEGMMPSTLYFESILAWSHSCVPFFKVIEDYFCIRLEDRDRKKRYFYMPVGDYKNETFQKVVRRLWEEENSPAEGIWFWDAGEAQLPFFQALEGFEVQAGLDLGDADYIFSPPDFEKRLSKADARYNLNYFLQREQFECRDIAYKDIEGIKALIRDAYCQYHACRDCSNGCLKKTIETMLQHEGKLNAEGIMICAKERLAGYIVWVPWKDTEMVLFKKNLRDLRGLDELLHKEMLKRFPEDIRFINYTEDMNLPGLRKYKEKWGPHRKNRRYRIRIRAKEEKK